MWPVWGIREFCWGNQEGIHHLEDLAVDGSDIDLKEIVWDNVNVIHLAQDKYRWRVVASTIIYLRVP
jgi:hypothetical protein